MGTKYGVGTGYVKQTRDLDSFFQLHVVLKSLEIGPASCRFVLS